MTLAWLEAAYAVPDFAPWIGIHNTRTVASYLKTKTIAITDPAVGTPFLSGACTVRNAANVCTVVNPLSPASNLLATTGITTGATYTSALSEIGADVLLSIALEQNVLT